MTFTDICKKEVIQITSGICLGKIDDLNINPLTAEIEGFIMFGRPKLFGLLGREDSFSIPWGDVVKFGIDAILIETPIPENPANKSNHFFDFLSKNR